MLVLNFSHPFTADQRADIARAVGGNVEVREVMVQYAMDAPLAPQARAYFDQLLPEPRDAERVAIRFPAMAGELMLAVALGRLGYLPAQVVIRAEKSTFGQKFVYSHIESLEKVRAET